MSSTATGLRFASALSCHEQTAVAVRDVVEQLEASMDGEADLVVAFATGAHVNRFDLVQRSLEHALKPQVLVGCSAEGVVGVQHEQEREPGISVLAARLPNVTLRPFRYDQLDLNALADAPDMLLEQTGTKGMDISALLMLADPFSTPLVKLLPAMNEAWGGAAIFGGMASSGRSAGENRLVADGQIIAEGAVGVAIGGAVDVGCVVSQGCRPIGQPFVITRAHRHIVQELGGRGALAVLQDMASQLSEEDKDLVRTNNLMVGRVINEYKDRFGRGDFLMRGLLGVDPDSGYVAIGDPQVRVGQTIQFHVRDRVTAREDFELLLDAQKLHDKPMGMLLCTCNGRGTRLFDQPHVDASIVHRAFGDVPLAGFFAAGELGPIGGETFLHGHTASLVTFRELKSGD